MNLEYASFIREILKHSSIFFIVYMLVYSTIQFLSIIVGSLVIYKNRENEDYENIVSDSYCIPITIIVPAYNEAAVIIKTIESLIHIDYKLFEIVIVDDGSTDETIEVLEKHYDFQAINYPVRRQLKCKDYKGIYKATIEGVNVMLVAKENGGKSDALNMGINIAQYPYFICIDADTVLEKDSLDYLVKPILLDDDVIAIGGTVQISNGTLIEDGKVRKYTISNNPLVAMQILEYSRTFLATRVLFDQFNGNLIISGAFGLFKKDIVIQAGGYDLNTCGEDMELVTKLHVFCRQYNIPYKIKYVVNANCWTQAPGSLGNLTKQRKRWSIGLFETIWTHKSLFCNIKFGAVSIISFFYFILYELLSPYIEVIGMFTMILSAKVGLLNIESMLMLMGIYTLFSMMTTISSFMLKIYGSGFTIRVRDVIKAFILCIFEITVLRFYLAAVRMSSLIGYRRDRYEWHKFEREVE